jgi:hypothetical protein
MNSETQSHGLCHLQDQPDAEEEVVVVDFDNLSVVNATVSNVSEWGCRLVSVDIGRLYKNIAIWPKAADTLVKAHVTSVKGNDAAVVFAKAEKSVADKRREKRNNVSIPVKIADLDGITEITGTIIDAGKNGCKISAKGLTSLPEEVLLTMSKFDKPVIAEFAWRNETSAGLRLLWHRTLEHEDEADEEDAGVSVADGSEDSAEQQTA